MDFDLPPDDDPRRLEIRAWLEAHPNPSPQEVLEAGYVVPHWPKPWGFEAVHRLIVEEELARAGVSRPTGIGMGWAAPVILLAGTEEQQRRYLPKIFTGEEQWCQLFSEPDAGSDLAGLTTGCGDPVLRQRLAGLYCEAGVLRLNRLRALSARISGATPGPEASIQKIMGDEHGQHVMDLAGSTGMLERSGPPGEVPPDVRTAGTEVRARAALPGVDPIWRYGFLFSPALTIGGGPFAVERNIVGELVLGLPRDP